LNQLTNYSSCPVFLCIGQVTILPRFISSYCIASWEQDRLIVLLNKKPKLLYAF